MEILDLLFLKFSKISNYDMSYLVKVMFVTLIGVGYFLLIDRNDFCYDYVFFYIGVDSIFFIIDVLIIFYLFISELS